MKKATARRYATSNNIQESSCPTTMEQNDDNLDDCEVTVEVLPETVAEVVYLSEQSSPDNTECEKNYKGEGSNGEDPSLVLDQDSSTYVVLAENETANENVYITEEELQKNYYIVNNPIIAETAMRNVLYACEACNSEFDDYQELLDHFSTKHPVFVCNICGCSCISENTLMSHYKTHEPKRYSCDICCVEYENLVDFQNHKKTHSTHLLYACNICDAPFDTTYNVSLHIRTVHSKQRNTKTKPFVSNNLNDKETAKKLKR